MMVMIFIIMFMVISNATSITITPSIIILRRGIGRRPPEISGASTV
jgi:uncharacterized membrane protein (DUF441 family)